MSEGHTILSLDLGTSLGWAFAKDGVISQYGMLKLTTKDTHPGHRFLKFNNFLCNFVGVKEIFYEDVPFFESAYSARSYAGLLAFLQVFCLVNKIRLVGVTPTAVKKEFTGRGNANKRDMCSVCHKLGWRGGYAETDIDHDIADAIALAFVLFKRRGVEAVLK